MHFRGQGQSIKSEKIIHVEMGISTFNLRARSQYWATKVGHEGQKLKQECVT